MYTKGKQTISHVTPQSPMTEEEKRLQIVRFLSQKREQFATNILYNLCRVLSDDATSAQAKAMVSLSVEMADELMQKLYPMEREDSK